LAERKIRNPQPETEQGDAFEFGISSFPPKEGLSQTSRARRLPSSLNPTRPMEIAKQLSVFLANKPGTLAAVCDELARAEINIFALTISDTADHSVVRMVVSDPRKALGIFEERGVLTVQSKVLLIENSKQTRRPCENLRPPRQGQNQYRIRLPRHQPRRQKRPAHPAHRRHQKGTEGSAEKVRSRENSLLPREEKGLPS
jgi:hypothetical protein